MYTGPADAVVALWRFLFALSFHMNGFFLLFSFIFTKIFFVFSFLF